MKKINLDLDMLRVESFSTTDHEPGARGTVRGLANGTAMTVCVGLCGGYGETEIASCGCPTDAGCVYPTAVYHSCDEMTLESNEARCYDLYPDTDIRICCSNGCTGAGGMC